jgi:hypothetical protein
MIGARFAPKVERAKKSFHAHLVLHLGDIGQVEACFGPFGDNINLEASRCTVCAKCTIGSEIAWGTPDGTPRWRRTSGRSFQLIWG